MRVNLDAATFQDVVVDPGGAEALSAAAGAALVVVDAHDASDGRILAGADITSLPAVVVLVARDPDSLPPAAFGAADVILTEDPGPGSPFVAPGDVMAAVKQIDAVLGSNPVAGASLAMLLRSSAGLSVPAALVAESAAYSALQDGQEFRDWRRQHPVRTPRLDPKAGQPGDSGPSGDPVRLQVERIGDELRITLARPGQRNALDWRMRDALASALTVAAAASSLTVFKIDFLWSMGVAGIIVSLTAGTIALTVLPSVLRLLGPRVRDRVHRRGGAGGLGRRRRRRRRWTPSPTGKALIPGRSPTGRQDGPPGAARQPSQSAHPTRR